jgi:uncharacterized coiled-coil protein SlyX
MTNEERIAQLELTVNAMIDTLGNLVDWVDESNKSIAVLAALIEGHNVRITDNRTSIGPILEDEVTN